MARVPELDQLAMQLLPDGRRFDEAFHFVHVYTVEAHPALPDPTPYRNWTDDAVPDGTGVAYGDVRQAMTWEARRRNANRVITRMENPPLMLLDGLNGDAQINPVWCTYGTAPNAAYVIAQDGTFVRTQLWTDVGRLKKDLEGLVGPESDDGSQPGTLSGRNE